MELLDQIVSVVSGLVAAGAGFAAVRAGRRRRTLPGISKGTSIRTYHDETALAIPDQPRGMAAAAWVGSVALLVPGLIALFKAEPAALGWLGMSVFYAVAAVGAGRERSRTFRSASISIDLRPDVVMQSGHEAMKRMGLRVLVFDLEAGVIEARRGLNIRTAGERVAVLVDALSDGTTRAMVESDSVWKWTLLDYGANQRNVDVLVEAISSPSGDSV